MSILIRLVVALWLLLAAIWLFEQDSPLCLLLTFFAVNFAQSAERRAAELRKVREGTK